MAKPDIATNEGTQRFASRTVEAGRAVEAHFRNTPQNLILSSIGMGSYLGEPNAVDDEAMEEAVVQSVLGGVNVIDTAINYRFQKSERSIGRALETLFETHGIQRDELFIASKNGFLTPDGDVSEDARSYFKREFLDKGILQSSDIASGCHCMTPTYLADQLDRSLANLGIDSLDLMYLHNAAESQTPAVGKEVFLSRLEKAFAFYEEARQAGKIRYYGMATWTCFRDELGEESYLSLAEVVRIAERVGGPEHGFRFIQFPFNLAMTEALTLNNQPVFEGLASLLEAAQAYGIGVFTSVPLLQGQLLQERLPKFEGVKTSAQACLQFVRSVPGILAPLVGHKQSAHVQENLSLTQVAPMDFDVLQDMLQAYV